MKSIATLLILIFVLNSCFKRYKIEITTEYIINEYWDKASTNFFEIEKMKVKKGSVLNIFQSGFKEIANQRNIVEKLGIDSSFVYHYISSNMPIGDTIYFDKLNEGEWRTVELRINRMSFGKKLETVGNLQGDSWYRFSNLRSAQFFIYVYVDSIGKVYHFDQDLSNY